ncbi:hypothetical protein SAMN04489733_8071 [Amycolatopsis keratiniphila]|nr:hypothetical protein SAMN04489733_8071 [Amycolatopsis keratiniphila]
MRRPPIEYALSRLILAYSSRYVWVDTVHVGTVAWC